MQAGYAGDGYNSYAVAMQLFKIFPGLYTQSAQDASELAAEIIRFKINNIKDLFDYTQVHFAKHLRTTAKSVITTNEVQQDQDMSEFSQL